MTFDVDWELMSRREGAKNGQRWEHKRLELILPDIRFCTAVSAASPSSTMLRFTAAFAGSLASRNGVWKSALRAPRMNTASATPSSAPLPQTAGYTGFLEGISLKSAYISTMSFLHGGSRSLLTKAVVRSVVPRVAG